MAIRDHIADIPLGHDDIMDCLERLFQQLDLHQAVFLVASLFRSDFRVRIRSSPHEGVQCITHFTAAIRKI